MPKVGKPSSADATGVTRDGPDFFGRMPSETSQMPATDLTGRGANERLLKNGTRQGGVRKMAVRKPKAR